MRVCVCVLFCPIKPELGEVLGGQKNLTVNIGIFLVKSSM